MVSKLNRFQIKYGKTHCMPLLLRCFSKISMNSESSLVGQTIIRRSQRISALKTRVSTSTRALHVDKKLQVHSTRSVKKAAKVGTGSEHLETLRKSSVQKTIVIRPDEVEEVEAQQLETILPVVAQYPKQTTFKGRLGYVWFVIFLWLTVKSDLGLFEYPASSIQTRTCFLQSVSFHKVPQNIY